MNPRLSFVTVASAGVPVEARIAAYDWQVLASELDSFGCAFAVHNRPVQGTKGNYCVNLRHGVSPLRSGVRHTVGIISHDAK